MDFLMARLIIVPQYPANLRYQDWWYTEFPKQLAPYFNKIITLGGSISNTTMPELIPSGGMFSPLERAVDFETAQINQYLSLNMQADDILLLNDISYPGLFANILLHKRPKHCFAICHATSKNKFDYFADVRDVKYPLEKAISKLFTKVFVASEYHKTKLGWDNLSVIPLPMPPFEFAFDDFIMRNIPIVSVARDTRQKRDKALEKSIEAQGFTIVRPKPIDWEDYYWTLRKSKILLITSREETYGYQVVDAIVNGCIPIAPNKFSYPELLPSNYLYNTRMELIFLLNMALTGRLPVPELLTQPYAEQFFKILADEIKSNS